MRGTLFSSRALCALLTAAALAACAPRAGIGSLPGLPDASADHDPTDATDDDAAPDAPAADATPDAPAADAPDDTAADAPADVSVDAPADVSVDAPADVAVDAPADVAVDAPADAPTDASSTCRSDRDCSAGGQVCDLTRSVCVECLRDPDCIGAGQSCLGYRCVTPTRCTSSRMCPGQVCDTTRGACVDCVSTIDCPVGQVCFNNACGAAPPSCRSDRECSARMQVCNVARMTCVDCNTDVDCATGRYCADGSCVPQVCAPGSTSCADETTRRVCAADGRSFATVACPAVTNGASRCVDGACASTCSTGFADCDGNPANGCEVDLRVTPSHCGACATACPSANGTAGCAAGACTIACAAGFGNCDGDASNGCETNTASSNSSCGACGRACGPGQSCTASVCAITSCPTGSSLCGGACVDLNADPSNCGTCGRTCALPNATPVCLLGTCRVATCAAGRGNCNAVESDGCETDTTTSTTSCGACGRACAPANATGVCRAGACNIGLCTSGYGDCNGNAADGCEVNFRNSGIHCGGCGRACAAGQLCDTGTCIANPCGAGFSYCSGACRNLATDANNCGACGRVCAAGQSCAGYLCTSAPLRFTLSWNLTADFDLAVVTPAGRVINYSMLTADGGTHSGDSRTTGPESITWTTTPPSGTYSVCVIPFQLSSVTSYTVQVLRAGSVAVTRTGSYSTAAASGTACSRTGGYRLFDYTY